MGLTEFQLEVLGRVADDYEAVPTIRGDIERDLGRVVSEDEVGSALLQLVARGLLDSFIYDAENSKYQKVAVEASSLDKLWFLVSPAGRQYL
jgi:hypothetical protein